MLSEKGFWIQEEGKKEILLENKAVTTVRVKEKNSPRGASALLPPTNPRGCEGTGRGDWQESTTQGRSAAWGSERQLLSSPCSHHPRPPPRHLPASGWELPLPVRARPEADGFCWLMGAAEREGAEWVRPARRPARPQGSSSPPAHSGIGVEGLPPPRASTRPAWAQRWGPGPCLRPAGAL